MDSEQLETQEVSIERALDLLDRLLATADGGRSISIGQYDASAVLALLTDKSYRIKVLSRLDDFSNTDTGD